MRRTMSAILAAAALAVTGCSVHSSNKDGGDNVRIATPFGGLNVQSNQTTATDIGLPAYPGAVPVHDKDNNSANVGMSFGSFRLKVEAVTYQTPDAPDKVFAFYRKALASYGDVLECDGGHPVGQPQVSSSGLTCEDDQHGAGRHGHTNISINGYHNSGEHQLRAGAPRDFRLMQIDNGGSNNQTRFGLVLLELPRTGKDGETN
jgi:hypothetical protein